MRKALLLTLLLILAPISLAQESPVSLRVTPQVGFEPLGVVLNIRVPKHPDNRMICAAVQDIQQLEYYRSSCWAHGPDGPLQTIDNRLVRGLIAVPPIGDMNYQVGVELIRVSPRGDRSEHLATQNLRVMPR
jgi:hypothetical protein